MTLGTGIICRVTEQPTLNFTLLQVMFIIFNYLSATTKYCGPFLSLSFFSILSNQKLHTNDLFPVMIFLLFQSMKSL